MNIISARTAISEIQVPAPQIQQQKETKKPVESESFIPQVSTTEEAKAQSVYLKNVIIALPALVLRAQANLSEKPALAAV